MSFQKGIIFMGKKYIACVHYVKGKRKVWLKPINVFSILKVIFLIAFSMPLWFYLILFALLAFIIIPDYFGLHGLPEFTIIYFAFGTHFWFPKELKKFHGAEHKVFNYRGVISMMKKDEIQNQALTNRFCSTNMVVVYFLLAILSFLVLFIVLNDPWMDALEYATYAALLLCPLFTYLLNRKGMTFLHRWVLALSYWLQQNVTTTEPEDKHLNTAIRSYRMLAEKEFPWRVRVAKQKREGNKMAIIDITVIPIGTETTSVSHVVSEIHRILQNSDKNISYELTPMSTIIEGELPVLLEIIQEIHEVPFKLGYQRVTTNIRIDDRRDKPISMRGKVESVKDKLEAVSDVSNINEN